MSMGAIDSEICTRLPRDLWKTSKLAHKLTQLHILLAKSVFVINAKLADARDLKSRVRNRT
jgi:hypothetical protein